MGPLASWAPGGRTDCPPPEPALITGCLRGVNRVAVRHNTLLQEALGDLRGRHPNATIIFADFYTPIRRILENPSAFEVDNDDILKACCGAGGAYNWNASAVCGMPGVLPARTWQRT
ncbi:hypothetical protein ACP4OV_028645 [Aristida adscensionis]